MKHYLIIRAIVTAALINPFLSALAGNYTWTGAVDEDWENSANWAEGKIPPMTDKGLGNHTITIQKGKSPKVNVPGMAARSGAAVSPVFYLEDGSSLTIARKSDSGNLDGITGTGIKAVVGKDATLTYVLTDLHTRLCRNSNGVQSYNINGGTLNFVATDKVLALGDTGSHRSVITVDGGSVNIIAAGRFRGNYSELETGRGVENTVILKNGGDFITKSTMEYVVAKDNTPMVVFDLQGPGSVVRFLRGRFFNSKSDVVAQFGKVFISSTHGSENLRLADLGSGIYEVAVVEQ